MNALIDDIQKEVIRVHTIHADAIRKGRRSKALVDVEKIAHKHNVAIWYVDRIAGIGLLSCGPSLRACLEASAIQLEPYLKGA